MDDPLPDVSCIAILSPGDMGHAIGRVLRAHGFDIVTCLAGRSERTRRLSAAAGIREIATLEEMVHEAELILSILVPSEAVAAAQTISRVLQTTGQSVYYADCNAVSPRTAKAIDQIITTAGGRFIDASIIGFPPAANVVPRIYASGPHGNVLTWLDGKGIEVLPVGDLVGQASGLKMCYAAITKGTFALHYAATTAAEKLDLFTPLCAELEHSQSQLLQMMQRQLPRLPTKCFRWVAEMEQIAETLEEVGITPDIHRGAAAMFRVVSQSSLAQETPESINEERTLNETISAIAEKISIKDVGQKCDL